MVGECARKFCFGLGFLGFGVGCLGYPALLSAPVTLTLALSRQAGEGTRRAPPPPLPPLGSRFRGNDGGSAVMTYLGVFNRPGLPDVGA